MKRIALLIGKTVAILAVLVLLAVAFFLWLQHQRFRGSNITISGRIVDERNLGIEGCYFVVRDEDGTNVARNDIPSYFSETSHRYRSLGNFFITVHCDGYPQPWRSKAYRRFETGERLDLGTIVMKKEGS